VYTVYYVNCKGLEERVLEKKIYEKNTTPQRFSLLYVVIIERFVVTTTAIELSYINYLSWYFYELLKFFGNLKLFSHYNYLLKLYFNKVYVPIVSQTQYTILYFSKLLYMYASCN